MKRTDRSNVYAVRQAPFRHFGKTLTHQEIHWHLENLHLDDGFAYFEITAAISKAGGTPPQTPLDKVPACAMAPRTPWHPPVRAGMGIKTPGRIQYDSSDPPSSGEESEMDLTQQNSTRSKAPYVSEADRKGY